MNTRCPEEWDMPVMVQAGAPYPRPMFSRTIRCTLPTGHGGWHQGDGGSWAQGLPKHPEVWIQGVKVAP